MKPSPLTVASSDYTPVDVYCGLRDQILRLPEEALAAGFHGVLGALIETGYEKAVATLIVLADGTTSLYFSNGGGMIGAGQQPPVAAAASAFLRAAGQDISLMQPATEYPLPQRQHTRFYVLYTTGSRTYEASEEDLSNDRLPLSPLFHLAHTVIAAIRKCSELPGAA